MDVILTQMDEHSVFISFTVSNLYLCFFNLLLRSFSPPLHFVYLMLKVIIIFNLCVMLGPFGNLYFNIYSIYKFYSNNSTHEKAWTETITLSGILFKDTFIWVIAERLLKDLGTFCNTKHNVHSLHIKFKPFEDKWCSFWEMSKTLFSKTTAPQQAII